MTMKPAPGKSLGLLVSVGPDHPNFNHALKLAAAALQRGLFVYLYCVDKAVAGLHEPALQHLKAAGLRLYACAYATQQRHVPLDDAAQFSGLGVLSDLMIGTDRFLAFN